jgi:hypothetical protein
MGTGNGKTYTAFQIIWRLWKSRLKKRVLYPFIATTSKLMSIGDDPVPPDEPGGDETTPDGDRPPGGEVITDPEPPGPDGGEGGKRVRYFVNDVPVYVVKERVQYYGPGGSKHSQGEIVNLTPANSGWAFAL